MASGMYIKRLRELLKDNVPVKGEAAVWRGSSRQCDFCRQSGLTESWAVVDGKTVYGPWANMCEYHFAEYGVGLGTGMGQAMLGIEEVTK